MEEPSISTALVEKQRPALTVVHRTPDDEPITHSQKASFDRATKILKLRNYGSREILAAHTIGKMMKAMGSIKIGRCTLLQASEHISRSIEKCDKLIASSKDPEEKAGYLNLKQRYVTSQISVGKAIIKSAELDGSDGKTDSGPRVPFSTQPMVVAQTAYVGQQPPLTPGMTAKISGDNADVPV